MIEGRHREVFEVGYSLTVTACSAASFPLGLVDEVGGEGGGVQYILPPDWLGKVERIV